ncbi:50S ribosomal protein L7/L12 [Candidatus Gracilibacteria bacterium]|nr:50S ribosomal protein L7/L12 [Candidatus Gracilibacteria bacterium]
MSDVTIALSKNEQGVVDAIEKLTVVEANNVAKYFEEKYGIVAAAAAAPVAAGGAAAGGEEEEAKTEFNVVLKDAGAQKIAVIKVVREITGLGLAEAKALAEKGGVIKEEAKKEEAEELKKKFEEAGAKVELE